MPQSRSLVYLVSATLSEETSMSPHLALFISAGLVLVLIGVLITLAILVTRVLFRNIIRADTLYLKYAESLLYFLFLICGLLLLGIFFGNARELSRVLLGSTGLIVAIIGFAAQSAIEDVIAGLMIGLCRPFRLGDKITLEHSGISGTVHGMTIRHVVLHRFDGLYVVVPNSVMNKELIHNNSYQNELTGAYLEFQISYDSDIETAMRIIHDAVVNCTYAVEYVGDNPEYKRAAVYVTDFASSSVVLRTTVWTRNADESFLACSQIRVRVKKEFERCGVEIPYEFVNVVMRGKEADDSREPAGPAVSAVRAEKAEESGEEKLSVIPSGDGEKAPDPERARVISDVTAEVRAFCEKHGVSRKESTHLNMLAEELMEFTQFYADGVIDFSMLLNGAVCELKTSAPANLDWKTEKELMAIQTTGSPITRAALVRTVRGVIENRFRGAGRAEKWSLKTYQANLRSGDVEAEEISRSVIMRLSDDIRVGIKGGTLEITVLKKLWSVDI